MLFFDQSSLLGITLHKVGSKVEDEGIQFSKSELRTNDSLNNVLLNYFLSPFKSDEFYHLYHDSDIKYNEVYGFVSEIFDNPNSLYEQSVNLAKHLYEQSVHPKIKSGEFYTVYFKDCIIDNNTVDAVGLFKSENKDTFLKIYPSVDGFDIESEKGININKLDKGCLIFNMERENGYVVAVVDNSSKGAEAQYWMDDFLHVLQRKDEYYNTHNVLSLCKNFVTKELPQQFDVSKADQIDFLNKSVKFFKEKDSFEMDEFANEVIVQPDVIESFNKYRSDYQREHDIDFADNFAISETAVKKQARVFKSVIKLDKNFHIYIHGNRELIEQGIDEKGRKFYKIYYQEES
jgi:hypothetical protein